MERNLRIHREAIRETIRQLRAWSARWEETRGQAQRAAQALVDAAQAAPARAFEAATARTLHQLQQSGERIRLLADILEQALHHLKEAFLQAAQPLAEGWIAPLQLPVTPLAVHDNGRPLPHQFVIRFRSGSVDLPWTTACGLVSLSMALSRLTGRPIPAQEVADRMVQLRRMQPEVNEGEATNYTSWADLQETARQAYGIEAQMVFLQGSPSDPEAAWESLRQQIARPHTTLIALVTAKRYTTTRGSTSWPGSEVVVMPEDRKKGDGGILMGPEGERRGIAPAHWVVIDRLEERDGNRYVVINNPYANRQERYSWDEFWKSVNRAARAGNRWWVLSLEVPSETPERTGPTSISPFATHGPIPQ